MRVRPARHAPCTRQDSTCTAPGESHAADDQQGHLRGDVVGRGAAETGDERARVLAAERAQLSGEDDQVAGKRGRGVITLHGKHASSACGGLGQDGHQDDGEYD